MRTTTKNAALRALVILIVLTPAPTFLRAQGNETFNLTADNLQNGKAIALDKLQWKYHAGDDLNWAKPQFDDSAWETLNGTILTLDNLPKSGWNGIGWFRLRLNGDDALMNQQLALIMDHWGASEVYVDGRLVNQFGKVSATAETEEAYKPNFKPFLFEFQGERAEHLIAVRHSVAAARDLSSAWNRFVAELGANDFSGANLAGLEVSLVQSKNAVKDYEKTERTEIMIRFLRCGMTLMIGLLFFLLYLFYPSRKVSLYFSLFPLFTFFSLLSTYMSDYSHSDLQLVALSEVCGLGTFWVSLIFLLIFLYVEFGGGRIPKYFWFFVLLCASEFLLETFFPASTAVPLARIAIYSFVLVESIRLIFKAIRKKQSGAWIVGIGIMMFNSLLIDSIAFRVYSLLFISTESPEGLLLFTRIASTLGVTLPIAVYLARQFAQTNKTLEAQLIKQVEHERDKARFLIVEAENERRAKELEEARQLQLSMLPKKLPQIEGLEIAAYMKPATEVGGDYYDFHVGKDGTLTIAVGDATGHGLKAGTMVTAAKTLFNNLAHEPSIESIFKQSSAALKKLNLRGMFMAMTMAKIENNHLRISSAGMPSALIYRSAVGAVEEIAIRAVPLGSLAKTNYELREMSLATADCVVLMSDGFPEMFNHENEMLGFEKAAEVLPNVANLSAQEIINHLVKIGDEWADGRPQDDDVTFVVLKVTNGRGH